MNERDRVRLADMLQASREALSFLAGRPSEALRSDRILLLALVKELEIVGEAATQISAETREQLNTIPWRPIIGMRNELIHVYGGIDIEIVWSTVTGDLPPVIKQLEAILGS